MDDIVKAAMARWPNVPAVFGWLELSARGEWRIRGEAIDNEGIRDFISRNYANDGCGNWFFQNGPQRVFVSLEATPIIYRLDEFERLQAHTGALPRELRAVYADAAGHLFLDTELGPGLVDSQDTVKLAERLVDSAGGTLDENGLERWNGGDGEAFLNAEGLHVHPESPCVPVQRIASDDWAATFGYVARPGGATVS